MSYDSIHCPCGGRKLPETMLCEACETHVACDPDRRRMEDPSANWCARRAAAIRLLAVARRRCKAVNALN